MGERGRQWNHAVRDGDTHVAIQWAEPLVLGSQTAAIWQSRGCGDLRPWLGARRIAVLSEEQRKALDAMRRHSAGPQSPTSSAAC